MIKIQLTLGDAPCTEYFFHIAKLNQLLVLSQQLEEDIRHLGSHKYIAHQLSVIYVRRINHFSIMHQPLCFHSTISCVLLFFFAASHLLFQRNSGSLWNKERYWGQLQTDETVSSSRRRLQAWTSAGCSLHQLVSYDPSSKLAEMMTNAEAIA